MRVRLAAVAVLLFAGAVPLTGQEHGAAHPAPAKADAHGAAGKATAHAPAKDAHATPAKNAHAEAVKSTAKPAHGESASAGHEPAKPVHAEGVKSAKPDPVRVVPPSHGAAESKAKSVGVTPSAPPAQVAAAVAQALREAEEAQARRAARTPARPIVVVRTPSAPTRTPAGTPKKYDVRWPEQRMVVQWPSTVDDRVRLTWPESLQ